MTLLSTILGGGAWIVPLALLIGAAVFAYQTYKAYTSGAKKYVEGKGWVASEGKVPVWEIGQFWFSVILLVAFIAFFLIQNAEK